MATSLDESQTDFVEPRPVRSSAPWREKALLVLVLGLAAILMLAWLVFLGWVASLLLFALWP